MSLFIKKEKKGEKKNNYRHRFYYRYSMFILFTRRISYYYYLMFILLIRRLFHYYYLVLILARIEIRVFQKTFITRSMILLSLFEDYLIVVILRSIYYRYSTLILLLLFDFNSRKNRNSYFIKISLLYV